MKKLILLTIASAFSISLMAQDDDMYFVPTKENLAKEAKMYGMPQNVYYSGSNRSVDDYNRRTMFSYPADSTGNDIIDFSAVRGVYPDSITATVAENDDYKLTRRMSRFDDYTPSEAYWDGYRAGRWSSPWYNTWYSWYDPWYYDSWWYWNDPFYYSSWYYGWRYPYYYSTWYSPRYYGIGWYGRPYNSVRVARSSDPVKRVGRTTYDSPRSFGNNSNRVGRSTYDSNRSFGTTSRVGSSSGSIGGGSHSSGGGARSSSGGGGGGRSMGGRR